MSAVATVLALMLFVSFLSTFVLGELGTQMSQQEFQHELLVEDQMERLQTAILEAAAITGPPAVVTQSSPPVWNSGNLCSTITATACTGTASNQCSPPLTWNLSTSSTSFTFDLTGSSDCTLLNVTGNGDTITLEATGATPGYLVVTLFGFNDTILLNNQFTGSGVHAKFYLYGGYDTYENVGGPTGNNLVLSTYFVGESASATVCPSGNLSATDTWSISGATAGASLQNLTWYNAVGYSTPYTTTAGWPGAGNSGTGDHLGRQNVSAPITCAFAQTRIAIPGAGSIYLSSPVTLNSGGVPPFGTPSSGSLQVEPAPVSTSVRFAVANLS
ncbi:MAG: hypothetical protein WA688_07430, partial [Thermoplasmata archaeon]